MKKGQTLVREILSDLYSPEGAEHVISVLEEISAERGVPSASPYQLQESDACFICYANSVVDRTGSATPLQTLAQLFAEFRLAEPYPIVHLLPFFPWDTDRGFSVCNYREVADENGTWDDIRNLSNSVRLMFDFVANHASVDNPLVQSALIARHLPQDDDRYAAVEPYADFVIAFSAEDAPSAQDLSSLARPRAASVLTPYSVIENTDASLQVFLGDAQDPKIAGKNSIGRGFVWTTFSRGMNESGSEETRQVDLNFKNPKVFLETVRILLFYVDQGARLIRLDAIGYLWKKIGSTSLHEPETHQLLVCLKAIMEQLAPDVLTVAEVNEPQEKVFGYLGSPGREESDIVYQFTHFPLAVHAVLTGNANYYQQWLATLGEVGGRQFVTVLGSHDGMGMKPARGILPESEIDTLLQMLVEEHGGLPNYAVLPGGEKIVYEVCATAWNLVNNPNVEESIELQLARYGAIVALGLQVRGLPAFYINGAFGCENYLPKDGLDENRSVNREIFPAEVLGSKLRDADSVQARVHGLIARLLAKRAEQPAFNPQAPAGIPLAMPEAAVSCFLPSAEPEDSIISLVNVSSAEISVVLPLAEHLFLAEFEQVYDVLSDEHLAANSISLAPYQIRWLRSPAQ